MFLRVFWKNSLYRTTILVLFSIRCSLDSNLFIRCIAHFTFFSFLTQFLGRYPGYEWSDKAIRFVKIYLSLVPFPIFFPTASVAFSSWRLFCCAKEKRLIKVFADYYFRQDERDSFRLFTKKMHFFSLPFLICSCSSK